MQEVGTVKEQELQRRQQATIRSKEVVFISQMVMAERPLTAADVTGLSLVGLLLIISILCSSIALRCWFSGSRELPLKRSPLLRE